MIIIGISTGNSFFTSANIKKIIEFAQINYSDYRVFIFDGAIKYNYMANGTSEEEATKKCMKRDKKLINKIKKISICDNDKIIKFSELRIGDEYKKALEHVRLKYKNDKIFKDDCLQLVKDRINQSSIPDSQDTIMEYLLLELPIFMCMNRIISVNNCTIQYHNSTIYDISTLVTKHDMLEPGQDFIVYPG